MRNLIFSLAIATIALTSPLTAAEAENYIAQYIGEPVSVYDYSGGFNRRELLYLVGQEQGDLIFRYDPRKPQEIYIPINSKDLKLGYSFSDNYNLAKALLEDESFEEALRLLRPIAYPIVQYLNIPPSQFNGFLAVELLFEALVGANRFDEALALVNEIPVAQLSPEVLQLSFHFANKLIIEGRNTDALTILNKLPVSEEEQQYFPDVMKFADLLRKTGQARQDNGLIFDAMKLYAKILQVPDNKFSEMASLWIAYCNIHLGKIESARIFIEKTEGITTQSKAYSLKRLIDAKIALREEDFLLAIEQVSKSVVYSNFSDSWAPEILYLTAYCYENLENVKTAAEIYGEVVLLYPSSKWADKSEERLARFPEDIKE